MGQACGALFTLALIAVAVRAFLRAIEEEQRGKALVLGLVIAFLLLLCCSGGYIGVNAGIGVDYGDPGGY